MASGRGVVVAALLVPALVLWAHLAEPNIGLPAWGNLTWGLVLIALGLLAGLAGAPLFPRPLATGFGIVCFGVAMATRSRAGLWLVAPAVSLGAISFSLGHARWVAPASVRLLPDDTEDPPATLERVRYWFTAALPWVALYEITAHMRLPGRAFQFAFEDHLPVYPWTSIVYQSTYLAVTIAPWLARTRRDLRRFIICAWVASLLVFPFYWLVPSAAPRRPMVVDGLLGRLLDLERNANPPSLAFPSFHVLWSIFVARLTHPAWAGWTYAILVAGSCISTGMHYIPDVLISFAVAPWLMNPIDRLWRPVSAVLPGWAGWFLLLGVAVLALCLHSAPASMAAGVFLLGAAMILFGARGGPDLRRQWPSALLLAAGVLVTTL